MTDNEGAVFGPVDAETLSRWIGEGRIPPDPLVHGGGSGEWLRMSLHPDFVPPRRIPRAAVIATATFTGILVLALIVAVIPLARSGRWGLAPDVIAGTFRGSLGAIPRPAAPIRSGVKALKAEPLPGIRIDAPAGALDRERTFNGRPLDAAEMAAADAELLPQGLIALGGYHIDAGMTEEDFFYEQATMTFDLKELGIPQALWEDVGLVSIEPDGASTLVSSHSKNGKLVFETYHNITLLPVLIPALLGTMKYGWDKDRAAIPKDDFTAVHWLHGDDRYRLIYPAAWPARNPAEVKRVADEYSQVITRHKLTADDLQVKPAEPQKGGSPPIIVDPFSDLRNLGEHWAERLKRLETLYADPDHIELLKTARSETWLKENLLPKRVTNAVIGLDRAWEYLDARGFRKPGLAKYPITTDTYIVGTSLGANLFGEVHNTWTTMPFMVLDGTKIPDNDLAAFTADEKAAFDNYQVTALHELFHVVQSAYVFYNRNKHLWFHEATALVLEGEAEEYYLKREQHAKTWRKTDRSHAAFFKAMEFFDSKNAAPNQVHGYGQSYFMEFLRDYYFTTQAAKDAFLPKLYDDFAGVRGDPIGALSRTTGGTPEKLSSAFYMFSFTAAHDLRAAFTGLVAGPERATVTLDQSSKPLFVLPFLDKGRPLSTQVLELNLAGLGSPGAPKPTDPVFVIATNGIEEHGAIVRLDAPGQGRKEWDEISGGGVLPPRARLHVMRAETYIQTPGAISDASGDPAASGPVVFGMFSGPAPVAEVKDEKVTITWKQSAAAAVKKADGSPALISRYRLTLVTPDGRKTTFGTDEPRAEFPVKVLDKIVQAAERTRKNKLFTTLHGIGQGDMITLINITEALGGGDKPKIKVFYEEVATVPGSPVGPISQIGEFEYGDEERDFKSVTGTWGGRVPFAEGSMMRLDIVGRRNGDFFGTMHWGDEIPIRGTWNETTKSWSIEGRESNVWMPLFLVFDGHLQKLPGERLYMFAPPALLVRTSTAVPDLGWTPEPGDTDLEDLLRQLQQEMDELQGAPEGGAP